MNPLRLMAFSMLFLLLGSSVIVNPYKEVEGVKALFYFTLSQNVVNIHVGPNESCSGQVNGLIHLTRFTPGVSKFDVHLFLEADSPILGDVTPVIVEFVPGRAMAINFTVFMRAPPYTPNTDGKSVLPFKARIKGVWNSIPSGALGNGEVPEQDIMVNIAPYYYFIMNADPPFERIWPGSTHKVNIDIYNQGNTVDTVIVEVENEDVWAKEGWVFEITNPMVTIAPRQSESVQIIVHAPQRLTIWENSFVGIPILGHSERAPYPYPNLKVEYRMSMYFQVWGAYFSEPSWAFVFAVILFILFITYQRGKIKLKFKRRSSRKRERRAIKKEIPEKTMDLTDILSERGVKPHTSGGIKRWKGHEGKIEKKKEGFKGKEKEPLNDILSGEEKGREEPLEEILEEGEEESLEEILS